MCVYIYACMHTYIHRFGMLRFDIEDVCTHANTHANTHAKHMHVYIHTYIPLFHRREEPAKIVLKKTQR